MEQQSIEEIISEMKDFIHNSVGAGFLSMDEIIETAVEAFSDDYPVSELLPHAKDAAQKYMDAHLKKQLSWEAVTDCDRLDQAFKDLESQGIISRQNFSCCGTCGTAEILDEMGIAGKSGKIVRGYTFYHMQDTESAVEGDGIYLNYGSIHNNFLAQILAGYKIVKTIKRHGLKTEWNGDLRKRIFIHLDWKRRR